MAIEIDLEAKILEKIRVRAKVEKAKINSVTLDSFFLRDLNFDSLDEVEMLMELEEDYTSKNQEKYGGNIPESVAQSFKNGRDILSYIEDPTAYISSKNLVVKAA